MRKNTQYYVFIKIFNLCFVEYCCIIVVIPYEIHGQFDMSIILILLLLLIGAVQGRCMYMLLVSARIINVHP